MSSANAYELLHALSQAIDDSLELEPMLQRFLAEMVRLLDASGAAVLESALTTPPDRPPSSVCIPRHSHLIHSMAPSGTTGR